MQTSKFQVLGTPPPCFGEIWVRRGGGGSYMTFFVFLMSSRSQIFFCKNTDTRREKGVEKYTAWKEVCRDDERFFAEGWPLKKTIAQPDTQCSTTCRDLPKIVGNFHPTRELYFSESTQLLRIFVAASKTLVCKTVEIFVATGLQSGHLTRPRSVQPEPPKIFLV